jgi:hypothetical protein
LLRSYAVPTYYCEKPTTQAEQLAAARANLFASILYQPIAAQAPALGPQRTFSMAPVTDTFMATLDQEFLLDGPVLRRLLPQLVESDPEAAMVLVAVAAKPPAGMSPQQADDWLQRWLKAFRESTVGGGNIAGNISASAEAALRRHWRLQAAKGFADLIAGNVQGKISLGKNIHVTTRRIGKGGQARGGARIIVRLQGQPTQVVQQLKLPYVPKAGGQFGVIKASPQDVQRLKHVAVAVADSRVQANAVLRNAGKFGGAALAFGPSAAIDFYDAYTKNNGASAVGKDFALRSARSQSGNIVAMGAGIVAVAVVGTVGAPAVVLALATGIVVQTVWGATGMDEAAGNLVKGWID